MSKKSKTRNKKKKSRNKPQSMDDKEQVEILADTDSFYPSIDSLIESDGQFTDNFQTREQKARDCEITKLLRQYVTAYSNKITFQNTFRVWLIRLFMGIIGAFSIAFLILLLYLGVHSRSVDIAGVVSLISICITFLVSILGLAKIVTKYCFPEKDEEYITKIVESIQSNDLSHKLANMGNSNNSNEAPVASDSKEGI